MHHHGSLFSNSDLIENLNSTPTWREKNDLRIDQHRTVGLNVLEMNSNRFWDSDSSRCHIWVELVVCKLTKTLYQTQKNCFHDSFVNFVMILLFFNYFKLWFIFISCNFQEVQKSLKKHQNEANDFSPKIWFCIFSLSPSFFDMSVFTNNGIVFNEKSFLALQGHFKIQCCKYFRPQMHQKRLFNF